MRSPFCYARSLRRRKPRQDRRSPATRPRLHCSTATEHRGLRVVHSVCGLFPARQAESACGPFLCPGHLTGQSPQVQGQAHEVLLRSVSGISQCLLWQASRVLLHLFGHRDQLAVVRRRLCHSVRHHQTRVAVDRTAPAFPETSSFESGRHVHLRPRLLVHYLPGPRVNDSGATSDLRLPYKEV